MSYSGNWNFPTPIRFGPGTIAELPKACRELGMSHPLLVTDPGLASLPIVEQALTINREAGLPTGLFSQMQGNPVVKKKPLRRPGTQGSDAKTYTERTSCTENEKSAQIMLSGQSLWPQQNSP